jgi:predicted metal-dependent HD superfamily phosphohydrolase
MILATKHAALAEDPDTRLLTDIDLAILGAPPARFADYERQIRQEYSWVPDVFFAAKRTEILRGFLARPRIYGTDFFRDRFEARARENLSGTLKA